MKTTTLRLALVAAATGLLLSACGGDDTPVAESPPPAPSGPVTGSSTPPDTASANTFGFLSFIGGLSAGGLNYDQAEPFDLSAFTVPTDDVDALPPYATTIDAS